MPSTKEEYAQKIIEKTHSICTFGSSNKKNLSGHANNEYKKVVKAAHFILNYKSNPAINKRIDENDRKIINELRKKIDSLELSDRTFITQKELQGSKTLDYLPLKTIIESPILDLINKVYPLGHFKWNKELLSHLHACFSLNLKDNNAVVIPEMQLPQMRYNMIEKRGCSDSSQEERLFYFGHILSCGKELMANYGVGNCDALADLAFFEAFALQVPFRVTRVCFYQTIITPAGRRQTNPAHEEVNVIVLGDWPQPGCLIISPWEGKSGKHYYWQGNCARTPELAALGLDYPLVLFRDFHQHDERKQLLQLLSYHQYPQWEQLPKRQQNFQDIESLVARFSQKIQNFMSKEVLKATLYAISQDQSFWNPATPKQVVDLVVDYAYNSEETSSLTSSTV